MSTDSSSTPPTSADIERLVRRGTQSLQAGRQDEAIALLEQALQGDPDHFDAALNLSAALILRNRWKQAIPLLERLTEREPHNAMLWTNLGAAYLGNPVLATDVQQFRAVQAFVNALEIDPRTPNVAYNIGLIHKDRKEYPVAIRWFHLALRTNPADQDARTWIGKLEQHMAQEAQEAQEGGEP
jgi:tetratricopeptide (TPR) repeat protein